MVVVRRYCAVGRFVGGGWLMMDCVEKNFHELDKASTRERKKRCSQQRGGQDVGMRKKRVIQPAARRARCQQDKETSYAASSTAGKTSARERNDICSERHGAEDVSKREKRAVRQAAWRARRRQEKETSDVARDAARKTSARERNE
jgi:hypothetical protein